MKKLCGALFFTLLCVFCGCRSAVPAAGGDNRNTGKIVMIPFFPELCLEEGGNPAESFWARAARISPRKVFGKPGLVSEAKTEVRLCMDRKNLCIGIVCEEPASVHAGTPGASPWTGDNVEFFIADLHRPLWYRQLVVGANGTRFSRMLDEKDWTAAVSVERDRWSAKIVVPLARLGGMDGGVVVNVLRERKAARELISYRDLAERALEVERFGKMATYSSLVRAPWTFRIRAHGAGIAWETAVPSAGKLFYRKVGDAAWREQDEIVSRTPYIRSAELSGLEWNTEYEYIVPGMTEFGRFRTLDPVPGDYTFAMTTDVHTRASRLAAMLERPDVRSAELFFLLGDQVDSSLAPEMHHDSFLDAVTAHWNKPFYCVYGNHEGRGAAADSFYDLFCHGKPVGYDAFSHKGVFFVILDTDHDNGISETYRREQIEFLKKTIHSPEFRQARWRVLISHVPITFLYKRWGADQAAMFEELSLEEYNAFDVAFSGHIHHFCRTLPGEDKVFSTKPQLRGTPTLRPTGFPEFTGPELGLFLVRKTDDRLCVKIFDQDGTLLDDREIRSEKRHR